jgi:hypothetical protein
MNWARATQAGPPTICSLLGGVHLRLILFAVLLAAASLTLSGGLVIRSYAQRNLDLLAQTMAYTIQPAVVSGNRAALDAGIALVASSGDAQQVEVRDAGGEVLARWHNSGTGWSGWVVRVGNNLVRQEAAAVPLMRGSDRIGEVRIIGNAEGVLRFALAGLINTLCTLALTFIAGRILARCLQSQVIGPLERVAEVAHAVRIERVFDQRVPETGIAVIARFGQDFNALLAELQGWHAVVAPEPAERSEPIPVTAPTPAAAANEALQMDGVLR